MPTSVPARLFGLDLRSLAAFRVMLGVLLVLDALDRARDVRALLTDRGVLPVEMAWMGSWRPSLPFELGGVELGPVWLGVLALAGAAIAAGWFTRIAVAVAWVVVVSLQARNHLVLYGGDILLRMLLFWAFFLPLDAAASVAARRRPVPLAGQEESGPPVALSGGTFAYTWQIALLYFATFVLKRGDTWHDGTAGWYAVHMDAYTGVLGSALRSAPGLLKLGTWAVLLAEALGPWLLFIPWRTAWWRTAVLAFFVAFHLSLEATLQIGWFPWISVCCWLPLVPGEVWDRLGWLAPPPLPPATGWRRALGVTGSAAALAAVAMVTWWNLAGWWPEKMPTARGPVRKVAYQLRLDQHWDMYAPNPALHDGWFVARAQLASGRSLDLITRRPPTLARPPRLWGLYGSSRFNKYMHGLWDASAADLRDPYLRWQCASYNREAEPGERALDVELVLVRERSPRPGEVAQGEPREQIVARLACPKGT
jgi:hypothetical protein